MTRVAAYLTEKAMGDTVVSAVVGELIAPPEGKLGVYVRSSGTVYHLVAQPGFDITVMPADPSAPDHVRTPS